MVTTDKKTPPPFVTILTPVYNEEEALSYYYEEVKKTLLDSSDFRFQVVFIEDGSKDRSWEIIQDICARDERFQGLRLSRNFGSHVALSAGFDFAEGDIVCTLACDLQDPPETILQFLDKWKKGANIVWGKRRTRDDTGWRILCSRVFSNLIKRYAMPRDSKFTTGSFLLADKKVVECVRRFKEHNRITFALIAWTGFNQAVVEYDRKKRVAGVSGWSFSKMLKSMYDTFIGFSLTPVRVMTLIGASVSFASGLLLLYLLFSWFNGVEVKGWTSYMVALTSFFGLQFLCLGVVGEYLYRIYAESVRRPLYFISEKTTDEPEFR